MHSIVWYIFTIGIPVLGLTMCSIGGVVIYRWARRRCVSSWAAALMHFLATTLPMVLAELAMKLGSYLANRHDIYVFSGEDSWALFTVMIGYFWLAVVSNVALWIALLFSRKLRNATTIT